MAKLEAGEVRLDLAPASVEEIIDAALAHCKSALAGRRVNVRVADGLPPVRADLERAKEALVQLIENANLYSPKEEPITITSELTGDTVTTSVADHGPGIDDFEQTMIFRSEEHTSELQSHSDLVCRLLLEKKKKNKKTVID